MRSIHRLGLVLGAALLAGACLGEKRPAATDSPASSSPAASGVPTDPDVESLRKATGGGWKEFYVLSPEESQTDDPSLGIKLVRISKLRRSRVGIVMEIENHRDAAVTTSEFTGSLIDGDDRSLPVLAKPSEAIAPDTTRNVVWIFDMTDAAKGSLEMRIDVPGTKTWPVVFSKEKPPDFKPTPNPAEGQQGPGPGGPGGPQGY